MSTIYLDRRKHNAFVDRFSGSVRSRMSKRQFTADEINSARHGVSRLVFDTLHHPASVTPSQSHSTLILRPQLVRLHLVHQLYPTDSTMPLRAPLVT